MITGLQGCSTKFWTLDWHSIRPASCVHSSSVSVERDAGLVCICWIYCVNKQNKFC